ncbi:MAG TPA: hypothetical protein VNX68_19115 [Nitrosopumilaceae archaeon]|jgi:hypothetical protein|nr:hypothetical protein [Nitrosopumilaceae archaeon]
MPENNRPYESIGDAMPAVAPPKPVVPDNKPDKKDNKDGQQKPDKD